jgi:hypothetical protein
MQSFRLDLPDGEGAWAIRVRRSLDLRAALAALGLSRPRPALALAGGADGMSAEECDRLRPLFVDVLAPAVARLGASVVDGGTATGVMALMGEARAAMKAKFSLVGVAAIGTITFPGAAYPPPGSAQLEAHHSHFVLVPGAAWGDEVGWIADVTGILAAEAPSVTLLIGGGRIAYDDVAASVTANRPVIALRGSGGTADELATALDGAQQNQRVRQMLGSGLIQALDPFRDPAALADRLQQYLAQRDEPV